MICGILAKIVLKQVSLAQEEGKSFGGLDIPIRNALHEP